MTDEEKRIRKDERDKWAGIDTRDQCDKPPQGWRCTRGKHDGGPCAAVPVMRYWTNTDADPGPLLDEYGRTICLCPECHREHFKNGGAE